MGELFGIDPLFRSVAVELCDVAVERCHFSASLSSSPTVVTLITDPTQLLRLTYQQQLDYTKRILDGRYATVVYIYRVTERPEMD